MNALSIWICSLLSLLIVWRSPETLSLTFASWREWRCQLFRTSWTAVSSLQSIMIGDVHQVPLFSSTSTTFQNGFSHGSLTQLHKASLKLQRKRVEDELTATITGSLASRHAQCCVCECFIYYFLLWNSVTMMPSFDLVTLFTHSICLFPICIGFSEPLVNGSNKLPNDDCSFLFFN